MRVLKQLPAGTLGNTCFVTQRKLKNGERCVDLNRDVEDMPVTGRLVVSETAVEQMVKKLGYTMDKGEQANRVAELEAQLADVESRAEERRELLTRMAGFVEIDVELAGQ